MASRARPEKLFRGGSTGMSIGKASKRPATAPPAAGSALVKDPSQEVIVDADLTRALKQIFEVRNCKVGSVTTNNNSRSSNNGSSSEESSVTLFGRKLSSPPSTTSSSPDESRNGYSRQGTDKLPPAATAHLLKELHKQRLKQRGITPSGNDFPDMGEIEFVHTERRPEVSTLPLLNTLQEKKPQVQPDDAPQPKRQRIEQQEDLDLSLSTVFGPPDEEVATTDEHVKVSEMRSGAAVKNPEQLTLFYNGQVLVYEDVSLDKAKAIMVLAKSISSKSSSFTPAAPVDNCNNNNNTSVARAGSLTSPRSSDLSLFQSLKKDKEKRASSTDVPQARKASIQRFLEKRKDRYRSPSEIAAAAAAAACEGEEKEDISKKEFEERPGSPSPGSKQFSGLLRCDTEKMTAEMQTESTAARQWIGV